MQAAAICRGTKTTTNDNVKTSVASRVLRTPWKGVSEVEETFTPW